MSLQDEIIEFLTDKGALSVGFANKDTMAGGPPSTDITYKLPDAKSAICFTLPMDRDIIRAFLRKDLPNGRADCEKNINETIMRAYYTAKELRFFLEEKGYSAIQFFPNNKYREDIPNWQSMSHPELSLRYVAVRSGAASYGWSGNVGIKNWGAAIKLGGLVTSAELEPTEPIPPEENFCDKCKLCVQVCPYEMFSRDEDESITLGGVTFSHAKRINKRRCDLSCGGAGGLDKSRKWSTWSPGRYDYPENDEELRWLLGFAEQAKSKRPLIKDASQGFKQSASGQTIQLTCGNCNVICWGDSKETAENYKLLINSGCILQKENGEMIVLPTDEAEKAFKEMSPEHQSLYYTDYKSEMKKHQQSS